MFKEAFLGNLSGQLLQMATEEVANGKLTSPANLDEICGRLTPALRKNPITNVNLKMLKVTDEDLRDLYRTVLKELSIEVVEKQ